MTELFKLKGKEGWFLFKENVIKEECKTFLMSNLIKAKSQRAKIKQFYIDMENNRSKTSKEFITIYGKTYNIN